MTTPAHHLINGTTPGGKADVAKADKKGGRGRKALKDISNSRKPSVEKDPSGFKATGKGKVGGRKALSDVTNSVKPPTKQQQVPRKRKLNAEEMEVDVHDHQKCHCNIGYFSGDLDPDDVSELVVHPSLSPFPSPKEIEIEEPSKDDYFPSPSPPKSPESPPYPYMSWGDDIFSDEQVMESP